ncbi:MAG: arginine N-succinyltransferase [Tepidisphaeraceae bacterium]|jgi:arginine N-succinyltransferase
MVIIRPVTTADLEPLLELAGAAGAGLTTLPKDRDILNRRIQKSLRCMEQIPDRPGGETYLFVMEDLQARRVVGASGIVSKVGGFEPFYAYKIRRAIHQSRELKVRKEIRVLHLIRQHNGPAEIGSLYLSPEYRGKDNGRLLQLSRFLFLAEHRDAFEPLVVSELRGVIDASGKSAFWDALGRHFFDIEFRQADYLSVVSKKFIADLMPRHPIYIPLLPQAAQDVIGKPHESSRPALRNLEDEGFKLSAMVDIFDAGPCVWCQRDEIRTVRESLVAPVAKVSAAGEKLESANYLIAAIGAEFRACVGKLMADDKGVTISDETAEGLRLKVGDKVRYALVRPAGKAATRTVGAAVK